MSQICELIDIFECNNDYIIVKEKTYNILCENFINILLKNIYNIGILNFLELLESNNLENIINEDDLESLKEELTQKDIEKGIYILDKEKNKLFLENVFHELYIRKKHIINNVVEMFLSDYGTFSLFFNLNSNQPKKMKIIKI